MRLSADFFAKGGSLLHFLDGYVATAALVAVSIHHRLCAQRTDEPVAQCSDVEGPLGIARAAQRTGKDPCAGLNGLNESGDSQTQGGQCDGFNILQNNGEYQGWWNEDGYYIFVDADGNKVPGINKDIAWLFMCCYIQG